MSQLKVIIFLRHYLPGYRFGGPVRSIANLVERLGDELDLRIVTLCHDMGETVPYADVVPGTWQLVGKAQVMYLPAALRLPGLRTLMHDIPHDLIYLQSAFDPAFSLLPLIANRLRGCAAAPVLLAPRGEFSPGALALKATKKKVFLAVARGSNLWKGVTWQATSDIEHTDILRQIGSGRRIMLAPNLSSAVRDEPLAPATSDILRIAFLSRISPKKNLLGALHILSHVSNKTPVKFTIFGPKEDSNYWNDCESKMAQLPEHVKAVWGGSVEPKCVRTALASHDLFLFPTYGENFGHVIVDAMSAGLPLLLSDQTPWRGLQERGVGADLPLSDAKAFAVWIEQFAALPLKRRQEMRHAVLEMAYSVTESTETLESSRMMFRAFTGHSAS